MTDALQFEVKKDKWEQLQNGSYKLTVTMNPTDLTDNNDTLLLDFIKCAPGSRFILAAVRIDDDEQPVQPKEKTPFKDWSPSRQAGKLCKDLAFQKWCEAKANSIGFALPVLDDPAEVAAYFVRQQCHVKSRAALATSPEYEAAWKRLNSEFEADTGRTAEQR